jgi:transposase
MSKKTKASRPRRAVAPSPLAAAEAATASTPASAPKRPSSRRGGSRKKQRGAAADAFSEWEIKHPDAAGIDIGSREHWVAVPKGRAEPSTRPFGPTAPELDAMVEWLRACHIRHVAMESTGMYWLPVYERLEEAGFHVILADARQTKSTSGRKNDLRDCEWIGQLHTYGLLRAAFRPADEICRLRTLQRHRRSLVEAAAQWVQHIQKALDAMNLHLHQAISDITGESGLAMLTAIAAGERDPRKLAAMAHRRIKASQAQLIAALTGHYREEELFVLRQALASYHHHQQQIVACEEEIAQHLESLAAKSAPAPAPKEQPAASAAARHPQTRKAKEQHLAAILQQILGVDLTALPGLGAMMVLTLLSEIGRDMSRWRHAKAFASWLGLCPNHRISGGRLLSSHTRRVVHRAATAFRLAALAASRTQTPLGCFYRRKAAQFGAPKAITATARKMACLVYELIRTGQEYKPETSSAYQKRYDQGRLKSLRKRAHELGYELQELPKAA